MDRNIDPDDKHTRWFNLILDVVCIAMAGGGLYLLWCSAWLGF